VDSFAGLLWPNYDNYEAIFALVVFVPAFIGELSMAVWLLVKGINVPQQADRIVSKTTPAKAIEV